VCGVIGYDWMAVCGVIGYDWMAVCGVIGYDWMAVWALEGETCCPSSWCAHGGHACGASVSHARMRHHAPHERATGRMRHHAPHERATGRMRHHTAACTNAHKRKGCHDVHRLTRRPYGLSGPPLSQPQFAPGGAAVPLRTRNQYSMSSTGNLSRYTMLASNASLRMPLWSVTPLVGMDRVYSTAGVTAVVSRVRMRG
jgi:hypothetical protein